MFTCTKCGKKAKTSYERVFGDKPSLEPVGYYCHTCGIFYDTLKKVSRVVYGAANRKNGEGGVRLMVAAMEQDRIQRLHKPYTNLAENVYENQPAISASDEFGA